MKTVVVKDIEIGRGIPKICVPVMFKTEQEALLDINDILNAPFDIVEVRADYIGDTINFDSILRILEIMRDKIENKAILFTFRTVKEGGKRDISDEDYEQLNEAVIKSGLADLIDIELFTNDNTVNRLITLANKYNVYTIISSHDFKKTPHKEVIVNRLLKMFHIGGDIAKIAVMPNTLLDVCTLLCAMSEIKERCAGKPFTAIAMSKLGVISRISGEIFGSAITFGSKNNPSAPGQIEADDLNILLKLIHKNL